VFQSDITSRLASLSSGLPPVIIVTAVLIASSSFLWPVPLEFPMDDTYILCLCPEPGRTGKVDVQLCQ